MSAYTERHARSFGGWLVLLAIAYGIFHHVGTVFAGLGEVGPTRWADWIDLVTPYVVIGAVAGTLRGAGASRGTWAGFWVGSVLYTQGHGIHLGANSIGNTMPEPHPEVVYLWDEILGHYIWYGGFAVLVGVLAVAVADRRPRGGIVGHLLALVVGFTHMTNSVEGQTPWLGVGTAAVFATWGLLTRDGMGRYLLTAYGTSLVLLAAFGIWQGGFPEFSELGWT